MGGHQGGGGGGGGSFYAYLTKDKIWKMKDKRHRYHA
jgi:hypothetical protein